MGVAGSPPAATPRLHAAFVVVLGALSAFGPLCLDMYLPALPDLAPALDSTATAAQFTLSACILGLALGQLIAGPLSDTVGRRPPLVVGVLLFTAVSAACAVTTSMPLLIALRFVQGVGGAAGIVVGRAVIADRYTGSLAASYFAAMAAINGLAPIASPIIGAQLLTVGSWRLVFWVLAGIGVLLTAATYLVIDESLPADQRTSGGLRSTLRSFIVVLRDRAYVGYTLTGCFVAAAMFGYISGSPFLMQDGFGLSAQQFSFMFAVNGAGVVLATYTGGRLLRWFSAVQLLGAGVVQATLGSALLAAAIGLGWGVWPVMAGFFVLVSSVGLALTYSAAVAMQRQAAVAGAASAVFGLAQWVLAAAAAPVVGFGDRSAGTAVAITAVICILAAGASFWMARRADPATAHLR